MIEQNGFSAAWGATTDFMSENQALLLPLAGMFLFLPQLLFQFGAQDLVPGAPLPDGSGLRIGLLVGLLLVASLMGQLTITRMAAGRTRGVTLGEELAASASVLLPAVAALLLQSIAIGIGLVALFLPGIYLIGRLLFVLPVLACETSDPIEALKRSWALTAGNGFRLAAFVMAIGFAIIFISVLLGGVGAAIGVVSTVASGGPPAEGWGIGRWLFELLNVSVSALLSVTYMVFVAQLYRTFRC